MDNLIHRAPTVGSLVKRLLSINPELGAHELIEIVRQATSLRGEFEAVDEDRAEELARATLKGGKSS